MVRPVFACLMAAVLTAPANAHIVFAEPSAAAGGSYVGFPRVSHGCKGSDTRSIRVEIPASILVTKPQPKAGWTLAVEKQPLKESMQSESGSPSLSGCQPLPGRGTFPPTSLNSLA